MKKMSDRQIASILWPEWVQEAGDYEGEIVKVERHTSKEGQGYLRLIIRTFLGQNVSFPVMCNTIRHQYILTLCHLGEIDRLVGREVFVHVTKMVHEGEVFYVATKLRTI